MESKRRFIGWAVFSLLVASVLGGIVALGKIVNFDVSLRVAVVYNLMARYLDESEEYFVLKSPAILNDLFREIVKKHPSLAPMFGEHPTMMILIDGTPSQPNAILKDGSRVDLMPLFDGG